MESPSLERSYSGTDITVYIFYPALYSKSQLNSSTPQTSQAIYKKLGSLKFFSWGTTRTKSLVGQLGRATGKGFTRGVRVVSGMMAFNQLDRTAFTPLYDKDIHKEGSTHVYRHVQSPDELPPFDLLLVYTNEHGDASYQSIKNVEIVQGQGTVSVDEVTPIESYSFVALDISPLLPSISQLTNLQPLDSSQTLNLQGKLITNGQFVVSFSFSSVETVQKPVEGITPTNTSGVQILPDSVYDSLDSSKLIFGNINLLNKRPESSIKSPPILIGSTIL